MECRAVLDIKSSSTVTEKTLLLCTGFVFEKALYVPYTQFTGEFYEDGQPMFRAGQVIRVRIYLDMTLIHCGMPDEVTISRKDKGHRIRLHSRGYTLLLAQNQPYPRINSNVTLKSLCQANLVCSEITYEDPTPRVGNIYVNEGSTVWEAAVAYCIKASGRYPYIKGTNMVKMNSADAGTVSYYSAVITEETSAMNTSMLLSDVYMKELGEDYPFEAHDTSAAAMKIVRSRYYPLDMQWLYDPQVGLQHKLDISNKGVRTAGLTYEGWKGEDIMYRASGGGDISGLRINYLRTVGGRHGIFTTVRAYDDRYGQK